MRPTTPGVGVGKKANTHGMAVAGVGPAGAAGEALIGIVTLPAGGPWNIWGAWSTIALQTLTPGESFGGNFRIDALDGDITPNPSPSRFPTGLGGSHLGATAPAVANQTQIWPVDWEAPGKARISLIYDEESAVTVATQVVLGILFGKTFPALTPLRWMDKVNAQITVAVDALIGTVTLAEKASRITRIGCQLAQGNVLVAGEELLGFFRLGSDDVNMAPGQYPCNAGYSAGLGVAIGQCNIVPPLMIPVDIPVDGGARIDCFIDLNTAVTNAAEVEVFIGYE